MTQVAVLPKPGMWMVRVKQIFGMPILSTATREKSIMTRCVRSAVIDV